MQRYFALLKRRLLKEIKAYKSFYTPGSLILAYHRVDHFKSDPQLLCVSPENFETQVKFLIQSFDVVPLSEINSSEKASRWKVAITFDDGYLDNLRVAAPILKSYQCPATFFVSTSFVGTERKFWWDELAEIILGNPLPTEQGEKWNVLSKQAPTTQQKTYLDLHAQLRTLSAEKIEEVLRQLRVQQLAPDKKIRVMNAEELRELTSDPLFTIGSHCVTHARLADLNFKEQLWELSESKAMLETILGGSVNTAAYPFGSLTDINADTARAVKIAGFDMACANYPGIVIPGSDPFTLPRVLVRDFSHATFKSFMNQARRDSVDYSVAP